jgi:hypothetical protein
MALSARTCDGVGDIVRSVGVRMWRERIVGAWDDDVVEASGGSPPKYRNSSVPTYTCNHLSFGLAVSEAGEGAAKGAKRRCFI